MTGEEKGLIYGGITFLAIAVPFVYFYALGSSHKYVTQGPLQDAKDGFRLLRKRIADRFLNFWYLKLIPDRVNNRFVVFLDDAELYRGVHRIYILSRETALLHALEPQLCSFCTDRLGYDEATTRETVGKLLALLGEFYQLRMLISVLRDACVLHKPKINEGRLELPETIKQFLVGDKLLFVDDFLKFFFTQLKLDKERAAYAEDRADDGEKSRDKGAGHGAPRTR